MYSDRRLSHISWIYSVVCGGISWFLISIITLIGIFNYPQDIIVDYYMQLRGERKTLNKVIIIAIDDYSLDRFRSFPWNWENYETIFQKIRNSTPSLILLGNHYDRIFPSIPPPTNLGIYKLFQEGIITLPLRVINYNQEYRKVKIEKGDFGLEIGKEGGILSIVPERDGVIRRINLTYKIEDNLIPAYGFEMLFNNKKIEKSKLRINYIGPKSTIPIIPAYKIFNNEVQANILQNKIIIFGITSKRLDNGMPTPLSKTEDIISLSEIFAHSLATIIDDEVISDAHPFLQVIFIFFTSTVTTIILRRLPILKGFLYLVIFSIFINFIGYILFYFFNYLINIPSLIVVSILIFLVTIEHKVYIIHTYLSNLVNDFSKDLSLKSDPRAYPEGIWSENKEQFWASVTQLATLYIEYESMFLAERIWGGWHIIIQSGHGSQEEEIKEKRRDIRRIPYAESLRTLKPVEIEGFMKQEDLKTLLVPLVTFGEIEGFWIINMKKDTYLSEIKKRVIADLASQISNMLHKYRIEVALHRKTPWIEKVFSYDNLGNKAQLLSNTSNSLIYEKFVYRAIIDKMSIGIIYGNLFGEIQFYNERLEEIVRECDITLKPDMTLIDFLVISSGQTKNKIISSLDKVIVDNKEFIFEMVSKKERLHIYRAIVKVVKLSSIKPVIQGVDMEGNLGIVCSFIDITELKELDRAKTNLLHMVSFKARNLLTVIQGYAKILIADKTLSEKLKSRIIIIKNKAQEIANLFEEFDKAANLTTDEEGIKKIPIFPGNIIKDVLEDMKRRNEKNINFTYYIPEVLSPVLADKDMLYHAFFNIIYDSVNNSPEGATVHVQVVEKNGYIDTMISDTGYGIPKDVIHKIFEKGEWETDDKWDKKNDDELNLYIAKQNIIKNGGTIKVESEMGKGTKFSIQIPTI